jgi:ubiquinone/menaquinone biosynthesis C-methylase UbiE
VSEHHVDYDRLAANYDSRYDAESLQPIGDAVVELARGRAVLEVGCGTGRWLKDVRRVAPFVAGADSSFGMLSRAPVNVALVNARANSLPFSAASFDLIYCVNALHHFDDQRGFIRDCAEMLRPGGTLAIVGIDPRTIRARYLYEYFESTRDRDLERYPSFGTIVDWLSEAGFDEVQHRIVHTWMNAFNGDRVFNDHFLRKDSNSSLALLSASEYETGLARIREAASENARFATVLPFGMTTGRLVPR